MAVLRYWMVSLPVQNSASSLWSRLQDSISKRSFDTPIYRFNVPNLRVETLDSLLSLSDDLVKSNSFVEGVSHKIRRQMEELEKASGIEGGALTVDGVPVETYLTSLVVRELSDLVKPEDIVTSEHLVTLLAVVPKYSQKDWLSSYETLATYVVPRSSKKLHEDNEYALYTVTLFRKIADNFKTSAREKGFSDL